MQLNDFSYNCKKNKYTTMTIFIPAWLRNRLISDGLELVLSHTKNHVCHQITDNFPQKLT